ncbi:MAG: sacsin N-terminal ATP-binding-like domain-containing protein [Thermodesulfobacteriota bacterium]
MASSIREAIEDLLAKREKVYRADPDRLLQDARGAQRAARDYRGRWLWELLQNCEDARASVVRLVAKNDAIYLADKGGGFLPSAMTNISGLDLSDKPEGTIGRKGVGFKAVFEVTDNPQIFSKNQEGLEFNPAKARYWLSQKKLETEEVPYQWLPFFLDREEAASQDTVLSDLKWFTTVIKLNLKSGTSVEEECNKALHGLQPENFLPFSHLGNLQLVLGNKAHVWKWGRGNTGSSAFSDCFIRISEAGQTTEQIWCVLKREEKTPSHLLATLSAVDRQHAEKVSWLVAAPLEDNLTSSTIAYRPIQVFYPTEVPAPVPLLLHGEFLVNTERTAILKDHPFNEWVVEELARLIVEFTHRSYQEESPAAFLRLLLPHPHLASHDFSQKLWEIIITEAHGMLRLPDIFGKPHLCCEDAIVPPDSDLARQLLSRSLLRSSLVHDAISRDQEVVERVLTPLGVKIYGTEDLLVLLATDVNIHKEDHEWLWLTWHWLAEWVGETSKWSDERQERVNRVKTLSLLPVDGDLKSPDELGKNFITWREESADVDLPEWLPLAFLELWFANRIKDLPKDNNLAELLGLGGSRDKSLRVRKPNRNLWREALEEAIEDFWHNPQDNPERFVSFLLESGWHEEIEATDKLKRCPIPVRRGENLEYEEAGKAYFSGAWGGGNLIERLWCHDPRIPWAQPLRCHDQDSEKQLTFYRWLGVSWFPKISNEEEIKTDKISEISNNYKKYIDGQVDWYRKSVKINKIEFIAINDISTNIAVYFLILLMKNWETYYSHHIKTYATYKPSRAWYDRTTQVDNLWWFQVTNELKVPVNSLHNSETPLFQCWIPDLQTNRILGGFLPIIDLEAFPADYRKEIEIWLRKYVGLRQGLAQVELDEWQEILVSLPERYPVNLCQSDEKVRYAVANIYRSFLDSDNNPAELDPVPLLCRRGDEWDYREECWLDDQEEASLAFQEEIWLMPHPGSGLEAKAARLPGVKRLSQSARIEPVPGDENTTESQKISRKLFEVSPFIYSWLRDMGKQEEKIRGKIWQLKIIVVNSLKVIIGLNDLGERTIQRNLAILGDDIYLSMNSIQGQTWWSDISQGLARILERKPDQDFYEILLRCETDEERLAKLRQKGMKEETIDLNLKEYRQLEPAPKPKVPKEDREKLKEGREGGTPVRGETTTSGQPPTSDTPSEQRTTGDSSTRRMIELIDPDDVSSWEPGELSGPITGMGYPPYTGGIKTAPQETSTLSQEEKGQIERISREICRKKLEADGYQVKEMPLNNPGYDLMACKDDEIILIEVKGHLRSTSKVEITLSQIRASLAPFQFYPKAHSWELWNIENLSKHSNSPVEIKIYRELSLDELDPRSYSLDLRTSKCQAGWRGQV